MNATLLCRAVPAGAGGEGGNAMKNVWWAVTVALCLTATGAWAGGEDETEAASAAPREMVEDPTTGKMLLAPRYGGSISYAAVGSPPSSDTWYTHHSNNAINGVNESLAIGDWGIDRDVFAFDTDVAPVSVMTGQLAESWTMPDDLTVIFTIRNDVFWRDRPPTNGRQLTAHDIVYNWHRYLGLGQFVEQGISPSLGAAYAGLYESITATDDRTVVFKLPQPRLDPLYDILFQRSRAIYPPEVIEEHGDVQDWRNNVGTGPFDLTEWVEESLMVWSKDRRLLGLRREVPGESSALHRRGARHLHEGARRPHRGDPHAAGRSPRQPRQQPDQLGRRRQRATQEQPRAAVLPARVPLRDLHRVQHRQQAVRRHQRAPRHADGTRP